LSDIEPMTVASYIESHPGADPTINQHLAAIRMLFDWLVTGQVVTVNPASSVRGPKYVVKKGKTPVLSAEDARTLLDSIKLRIGPEPKPGKEDKRPPDLIGLHERALIGVMVYSFARIGPSSA
jgi:site-specific recombinase XerD